MAHERGRLAAHGAEEGMARLGVGDGLHGQRQLLVQLGDGAQLRDVGGQARQVGQLLLQAWRGGDEDVVDRLRGARGLEIGVDVDCVR